MNLYKKEIMKVFLKFVGRYCKEKPILIIKYDVEMVLHEKTEEEFIEWILKYSKENFSSEKHLELESKIKFIIGRNIKFEIPGTQQILDKIAIKKINVDLGSRIWQNNEEGIKLGRWEARRQVRGIPTVQIQEYVCN